MKDIPGKGIDGGLERMFHGSKGVQRVEKRRFHGPFAWASLSNHGETSAKRGAERIFPLSFI